ncbi:MAG TPA: hypothetical protein VN791_01455 [Acidimicrobiales bacterium]|nr:hypothetical protein [Acidimicrobiales bacterium]
MILLVLLGVGVIAVVLVAAAMSLFLRRHGGADAVGDGQALPDHSSGVTPR